MHFKALASTVTTMLNATRHTLTGTMALVGASGDRRAMRTIRRAGKGARVLVDPRTHFRVVNALSRRKIRPVLDVAPLLMFKYLTSYLMTGLSRRERASILIHHYTVLDDRAQEHFFRSIVGDGLVLWRTVIQGNAYGIDLTFPRDTHDEGDLALIFRAGETGLYTLSFTIGPGSIASLDAASVMYIARVQGKGGALDEIRDATRDCDDISPAALLLAAAEGVAMVLGLERMVGISGQLQVSVDLARPGGLVSAYDEFWLSVGGRKLEGDMYELMVPMVDKPILSVKRCHRSRVRRKRGIRRALRDHVRAQFRESVVRGAASPVGTPLESSLSLG